MENTKETEAVDDLFTATPIGIIRSMQAFMRDLPELLANPKYDRWWVAYTGDERIGLAASKSDLVRKCVQCGLQGDQYYVGLISPKDSEEWTGLFLH